MRMFGKVVGVFVLAAVLAILFEVGSVMAGGVLRQRPGRLVGNILEAVIEARFSELIDQLNQPGSPAIDKDQNRAAGRSAKNARSQKYNSHRRNP